MPVRGLTCGVVCVPVTVGILGFVTRGSLLAAVTSVAAGSFTDCPTALATPAERAGAHYLAFFNPRSSDANSWLLYGTTISAQKIRTNHRKSSREESLSSS